jgi:chemotaxis signal transduction protein
MVINAMRMNRPAVENGERQYIVFHYGEENYGLRILAVEDILAVQELAASGSVIPKFFRYRGMLMHVIDLRGPMTERKPNDWEYCFVVIIQTECRRERLVLGLLMERSVKVMESTEGELLPPSARLGAKADAHPQTVRAGSTIFKLLNLELILPFSFSPEIEAKTQAAVVPNEDRELVPVLGVEQDRKRLRELMSSSCVAGIV